MEHRYASYITTHDTDKMAQVDESFTATIHLIEDSGH